PQFDAETNEWLLSPNEEKIVYALQHTPALTFTDIGNLLQSSHYHKYMKSLLLKEIIIIFEEISEKYSPKVVKKVRLAQQFLNEPKTLEELFSDLASKPKQLDVLLYYVQKVPVHQDEHLNIKGLEKNLLTSNPRLSLSAIN